ncbi:protein kinase domain-containing protein [Parachitinimonas caeni]|uniref:non-specific serine/threonine protein kinase n=1 Tax=Parachitinimonas caeni TaxID=3031301 RepID=A0ABT7DZ05_9NEIS|nr:winged helix-turn-helix domain-containing protein [Parachitinimonas caeni]MDK2125276.1 winged helix-turn-helix domain-containing protein [Parachitinimonas caeni]
MPNRYQFGASFLDESTGTLTINGLEVEIQPQSWRILCLLLARAGELVPRAEIEENIWNGRHVGENVLASAITRLRTTLGESHAGLIEALPKLGYRITAPVVCQAIERPADTTTAFAAGKTAPLRDAFELVEQLGYSQGAEVWLARQRKRGIERVFKYSHNAEGLQALKREASLSCLLHDQLGERADFLRVLDWNFTEQPYFLESEYGGINLVEWSAKDQALASLPRADRLSLFCRIATTVAAAHSVGVLHKDLKPANVLITPQAGSGAQLKLVDFGSGRLSDPARLIDSGQADHYPAGVQTLALDSAFGTTLYVSPEVLRGETSTERSDVFALGVMLYQLLIGDFKRALAPGWEREIDDALLVETIAHATDGNPEQRTGSAQALLEEISNLSQRHAQRQQEIAEREQIARDREAIRRNRARRPWVISVVVTLIAGLATSLYAYSALKRSEQALAAEHRNISALNRFLTRDLVAKAGPAVSGRVGITLAEALKTATAEIDQGPNPLSPEIRATVHAAAQTALNELDEFGEATAEAQKALAAANQATRLDPTLIAQIRISYARSLINQDKNADAAAQLDLVEKSGFLQRLATDDTQARYWFVRGRILGSNFQWKASIQAYENALAIQDRLGQADPVLRHQIIHANAQSTRMTGNLAGAQQIAQMQWDQAQARFGSKHYLSCEAMRSMAEIRSVRGLSTESIKDAQDAIACMQQAIGDNNLSLSRAYHTLSRVYGNAGQFEAAANTALRAAEMNQKANGKVKFSAVIYANAASNFIRVGQPAKAEEILIAALALASPKIEASSPAIQILQYNLASARLDQKKIQGVAELLSGLSAKTLFATQRSNLWESRLQYEFGRLALLEGHRDKAQALLTSADKALAAIETADDSQGEKAKANILRERIQRTLQEAVSR